MSEIFNSSLEISLRMLIILNTVQSRLSVVNCPRLSRQYKNSLIGRKIKFKQQTDFAFQAESVLF